jgi:superfamily II DNA or RNA helicase
VAEIKLRGYQRDAIDAVFKAWADGMRAPAIVLPTGAGKTVVFSALVREWRHDTQYTKTTQGQRVMILAHRDELVDQAIAKLRAVMPGVNVGKVKAEYDEIHADVIVASVQTLASDTRRGGLVGSQVHRGPVGLIITDECHHAAAASYRKIYDAFPDALRLGVTATMARGDGRGLGSVWDDVVFQRSVLWMISKGYLTDVRTKRVDLKSLDMGSVSVSRGDWAAGDLGRALMDAQADTAIARAYQEHCGDRQGIVFTPTVETACAAAEALTSVGVRTAVVSGDTPREFRQELYERYRTGKVQVLVNCMVLTEGFDMPQVSAVVIARPTQSETLYAQMVGRGLRPYPGKADCLVLDLVGASANKLRTLIDLDPDGPESVRDGETLAEAVVREAEEQNAVVPAGSLAFELKVKDVNSFAAFSMAWLRTPAGVVFIACGNDTKIYLAPSKNEPGLWDVKVARYGVVTGPDGVQTLKWTYRATDYRDLPLGQAMAWGEAVSEDYQPAGYGIHKTAPWRKKAPSPAMWALAARYGVNARGRLAGEVSDDIDRAKGAALFDRHVKG